MKTKSIKQESTTAKHTPTPWSRYKNAAHGPEGDCVFVCNGIDSPNDANAEFIVRAVNSHEALLAAAKDAIEYCSDLIGPAIAQRLREAIAQAEQEGD